LIGDLGKSKAVLVISLWNQPRYYIIIKWLVFKLLLKD